MKLYFISCLWLAGLSFCAAADEREQFYARLQGRDFSGMERVLAEWEVSQPGDTEMLVARGLFFYCKARRNDGKLPPAPSEEMSLLHPPRTGPRDRAGVPVVFDRKILLQAKPYWERALESSPDRLDLYFRLANLSGGLGDFEAQYATLARALQRADRRSRKLLWIENGELPEPRSQLMPGTLQGYVAHYLAQPEGKGMERARRLAKLSLTFYPRHPAAYHSLAAYYGWKEDWPHALKYLVLASRKDEANGGILNDIGNLLVRLGKTKEARVYFEKTLRLDNDPENSAWARKRLEGLGQGEAEVSD